MNRLELINQGSQKTKKSKYKILSFRFRDFTFKNT